MLENEKPALSYNSKEYKNTQDYHVLGTFYLCPANTLDAHYLKLFFAVLMEEIKSFLISTHCSRILLSS